MGVITNKHGLPVVFENALKLSSHKKAGDYSMTQILKDPTEVILAKRYGDLIKRDVSDMVNILIGNGIHKMLEDAAEYSIETEKELLVDINGVTVSGICDVFNQHTKTIEDYKTCSVYKVMKKDYTDWERQLNGYAYMLTDMGYKVRNLFIIAIMKDWSKSKVGSSPEYPETQIVVIPIELWDYEKQKEFMETRIADIIEIEGVEDKDLTGCEDKWAKPVVYKVFKEGAKRSSGNFNTEEEAQSFAKQKGDNYYVKKTGGEPFKCMNYCDVKDFCPWYQEYIKSQEV